MADITNKFIAERVDKTLTKLINGCRHGELSNDKIHSLIGVLIEYDDVLKEKRKKIEKPIDKAK